MKIVEKLCISLIAIAVFCFMATSSINAQTVYALVAIADADPSIGRAVEIDRGRIESVLTATKGICSVESKVLLSSRNELKGSELKKWLKSITPGTGDTVMIYYSGHGGMDRSRQTFLYLQDGIFWRSELTEIMENAGKCRLKLIITDCCSNGPEPPEKVVSRPPLSKKLLIDLFLGHQGLLHITAASEGEYSWCSPRQGGWFTRSLVESFDDLSDLDKDGFVSWDEVFKITKDETQKKFEQTYPYFSDQQKKDMKARGITSQTPKAYSLPVRYETLWSINNKNASFNISVETDKKEYNAGSSMTVRIKSTANCYIMLLNWNAKGELIQIFPNEYDSNNYVKRDTEFILPSRTSGFDFGVSNLAGEERIKVIAIRSRLDGQKISSLIPMDDTGGSVFGRIVVIPRKPASVDGDSTETKVIETLRQMKQSDWTSTNCVIKVN